MNKRRVRLTALPPAAPDPDPSAPLWWIGTALAIAASLVFFHFWAKPYLNVEAEGEVQIPPDRAVEVASLVTQERLERTVRTLAGFGSRLTGSPGAEAAADYLHAELAAILGAGQVTEETFAIDNPFDLGTEMEVNGRTFRVHPFWAPVSGTYVLPAQGKTLGRIVQAGFKHVVAGKRWLHGEAVVLSLPHTTDLHGLVLAAWQAGVFNAKLHNPITRDEGKLLARFADYRAFSAQERHMLDLFVDKHQRRLADFLFDRVRTSGARCLIFMESKTGPRFRVATRSFEDRILKHLSPIPRYLVPREYVPALAGGAMVRVRQAHAAITLESSGQSIRVYPLWPNLVRTASTPRAGLSGHLIWAGEGSLDEVKGKRVKGAIVFMDFNSGYQWMGLTDFGAKAILFAEPAAIMRGESESKYLTLPADIPRFWVPRDQVARLKAAEGSQVRVDAQVVWERRMGRTIIGRLPGTRPEVDEEPVIIQAYYDSVSVVPQFAPGGEQASGVAAMLELARVLKRYPLKKTVLFVLNAGHCQNMTGWTEWLHRHYIALEKDNKDKKVDAEYIKPSFVVHLDLTTRTRRLAVFYKGHRMNHSESAIRRVYSTFGKLHTAAGGKAAEALGYGKSFMVDAINAVSGRTWDSYIPGRFTLAQEITLNAGLYGVAYATPDDERAWVDTPQDLPDLMDFESLLRQTRVLVTTLPNVLNVGAAFGSSKVKNYWTSLKGRVVEFDPRVAYLPDRTVNGAMVWVHNAEPNKSLKGVRGDWFVRASSTRFQGGATFEIHGLANSGWLASGWLAHVICESYEMDPMDGEIRYAPDRGPQGSQAYKLETDMNEKLKELLLVVFPCRPLQMFELVDPLQYGTFNQMQTLDARTDSPPPVYGQTLPEPGWYVSYVEPLAIGFGREGMRAKFTFAASALGKRGKRGVLINATPEEPEGIGYLVGDPDRLTFTAYQIASDMSRLNDYRIGKLKRHGIVNRYLEVLNDRTTGRLQAARDALANLDYRVAAAEARAAWGLAARVYPEVESMALDVIKSALLYLALLIPFAFLMERLLLAFPNVTQQVGGALGIFLAMFLALRAVHPAFQIALTPIMVLLAFIIIALAVIVIGMVFSRFFNFLREEREASMGVHQADVSQVSVGLAAFAIGVSNMRKRVLRTTLTCVTLVVLTFAVLSLTSVLTAVKQKKYSIGKTATYEGLFFRSSRWTALSEPTLRHLETELGGVAEPVPRSWYVSYRPDRQNVVEIAHGDVARATAVAALGLTPQEKDVTGVDKCVVAGRWLQPGDSRVCLLPEKLAATLFIGSADLGVAKVVIFGVPFTVQGLFDPQKLSAIRDLDDEEITPVNFEATDKRRQTQNLVLNQEGLLPQRYDHHDANQLVILPHADLMRLGGRLSSIAVPMKNPEDLQEAITDLLSRLGLLVYVGLEKKTYAYSAIGGTTAGGLDYLLVPVLVAALIVFSTMLGAVQERTREISVFSSVGLAPNHVAILFFAEACVYALLGAVIGYLIGQTFSHLIVKGWVLPGLNVNYSSGAAVLAVVVVMVVVLLSTIYPARLASRLARPSKLTGFDLPQLVGDQVHLELPFSFNARDAQAICAFLAEHFDAHAEASAGEFSSGEMVLTKKPRARGTPEWHLMVRVWLAPYDFGVSQDMEFQVREGVGDESSARLTITRLSGDQASWRRVNTRFLKGIRKQFLIWRALGETARDRYHAQAERLVSPHVRQHARA